MNPKRITDIIKTVARQKRYSTLAKKEGDYAKQKEKEERKHGMTEEAKDSSREARIAYMFAKKRKKWAEQEQKKLKKNK